MKGKTIHRALTWLTAAAWLINGLVCKVLNLVPRHRQIVARILGDENAALLVVLIGIAEIIMAAWIVSGLWPRLNAITQILVIAAMNIIEFFLASDLLLWGKANAIFAFAFILVIYYNEFHLNRKIALQS
jgi:hypothetical protein